MQATDIDAIRKKLGLLISEAPVFVDRKRGLDADNAVDAILEEIDGTELSAQLLFSAGPSFLHLNVNNGNVVSVVSSSFGGVADGLPTPDDAEAVQDLAAHIAQLAQIGRQEGRLFVASRPPEAEFRDEPGRIYPELIRAQLQETGV